MNKTFTPGQAFDLTGVEPANQRLWRSKGYFQTERQGGWTRYSFFELVTLALMKRMVDGGMSLGLTSAAANSTSLRLAFDMVQAGGEGLLLALVSAHDGVVTIEWRVSQPDGLVAIYGPGEQPVIELRAFNIAALVRDLRDRITASDVGGAVHE